LKLANGVPLLGLFILAKPSKSGAHKSGLYGGVLWLPNDVDYRTLWHHDVYGGGHYPPIWEVYESADF